MNPNSNLLTKLLYHFSSYISIVLCLVFIAWSYIEPNFYDKYVKGELYLIWTVYALPWLIILANILWLHKK
jgi:hypothetical protein